MTKFIAIKGVLFLTFWQEVLLWVFEKNLKHSRFLPKEEREEAELYVSCLLVTFEMLLLSLLTNYAYSYKDYVKKAKTN